MAAARGLLRHPLVPRTRFAASVISPSIAIPSSKRPPGYSTAPSPNHRPRPSPPLPPFRPPPQMPGSTLTGPWRRASSSPAGTDSLRKTGLYDLHLSYGAKMVPFAGFSMPVSYFDQSVGESHRWTREKASLFDVGHMVQHKFSGPGAAGLLERITPCSPRKIGAWSSTLSCLLHEGTGGIVDDCVVARLGNGDFFGESGGGFYVVTNAACREKDLSFIGSEIEKLDEDVEWEVLEGRGLLALQGPESAGALRRIVADNGAKEALESLYFGQCREMDLNTSSYKVLPPVLVSRGGYTGEDGFEISVPAEATVELAESLLGGRGPERVKFAGLGARDSLRLEAGMCLYGHDLDDETTPVEAGLSWVIPKDRREQGGFYGSDVILKQLKPKKEGGGVSKRRIGLIIEGAPAREGAEILGPNEEVIGKITSGCPSPTLGKNIAMGYVASGFNKVGTELLVRVRGKTRSAVSVKMPFVPSRYWKQASGTAPA